MDAVAVIGYDLQRRENCTAHHTDDYQIQKSIVLRRGCDFTVGLKLSREFNFQNDFLEVSLARGTKPQLNDGSKFLVSFNTGGTPGDYSWKGGLKKTGECKLDVVLSIPVDCPIGFYRMNICTSAGTITSQESVVILFNPWNKGDAVYMESEAEREEYVLNSHGMIFRGSFKRPSPMHWNYAQYEEACLDAALLMLDGKFLGSDARCDPIIVSRTLAEMININDRDNGVLSGKWLSQGDDPTVEYGDGVPPTLWTGTEAILSQYIWSKFQPVKYAQCWVFAGALTTVLRTLGIPSRPVTNYDSAHDTEANRTIDYYYDKDGEKMYDKSADSIWNFHVWVDAWMSRPDLRGNFGGWQALDATPQEVSSHSNTMVAGPAPVRAVKDGQEVNYDAKFIIAEVNADIVHHIQQEDMSFAVAMSNTNQVGSLIATKAVGQFSMADITEEYKYPEGSLQERITAQKGGVGKPRTVRFSIDPTEDLEYGKNIDITVSCKPNTFDDNTIGLLATFQPVNYIGGVGEPIKKFKEIREIERKEEVDVTFTLSPQDYEPFLSSENKVQCTVFATVKETKQMWMGKVTQEFIDPEIGFKLPSGFVCAKLGCPFSVKLCFTNPLGVPLTEMKWVVEGSGLIKPQVIKDSRTIKPGEEAEQEIELQATRYSRVHKVFAKCYSKQLGEIKGATIIKVE